MLAAAARTLLMRFRRASGKRGGREGKKREKEGNRGS